MREWAFKVRAEGIDEARNQLRALAAEMDAVYAGAASTGATNSGTADAAKELRALAANAGDAQKALDGVDPAAAATGKSLVVVAQSATVATTALSDVGGGAVDTAQGLAEVQDGADRARSSLVRLAEQSWTVRQAREEWAQLGDQVRDAAIELDEIAEKAVWHQLLRSGAAAAGLPVPALGPLLAYIAAYTVLDTTVTRAVAAFDRLAAAQKSVDDELTRTGQAVGYAASEIMDLAKAEELIGGQSQQDLSAAMTRLLKYRDITEDVFGTAAQLIDELAAKTKQDLGDAATTLGEALTDPAKGFETLAESGIRFSYSQRAAIQSLADSGDKAESMRAFLVALRSEVGEAGDAMSASERSSHLLGVAWSDLTVAIGGSLQWFREAGKAIRDLAGDLLSVPWEWFKGGLTGTIERMAQSLNPAISQIEEQLARARTRRDSAIAAFEATGSFEASQELATAGADVDILQGKLDKLVARSDEARRKAEEGRRKAEADLKAEGLAGEAKRIDGLLDQLPQTASGRIDAVNKEVEKLQARLERLRTTDGSNAGDIDRQISRLELWREARVRQITEEEKGADVGRSVLEITDAEARAALTLAQAYLESADAAAAQEVANRAHAEALKDSSVAEDDLRQKLAERAAAESLLSGAREIATLRERVGGLQSVAAAAGVSAAAEAEAERQAQVRAFTEERLVKARKSGSAELIATAEAEAISYGHLSQEAAKASRVRQEANAVRGDQHAIETLETELRLVTASRAERAQELDLLKLRQELAERYTDEAERAAAFEARRGTVARRAQLQVQVEDTRAAADEEQRIWTHAGENIQDGFGQAFQSVFDDAARNSFDAAETIKKVFLSTASEIAAAFVFKPAVAAGFDAIGMPGIAEKLSPGSTSTRAVIANPDGSTSFAPATQGVGGSWLSQPVFGSQPSMAQMQGIDDVGQLGYPSGLSGWNPTWGQAIQGVGGLAGGLAVATQKGATTGQMIGGGLMGVGGLVAMVPGGQIVGGVMMAAGALLSAVSGAKDRGDAYSRSNITLGASGKYALGTFDADNDGNPKQFNADAAKIAKGLNDIAARLNLTATVSGSFIDTKNKSAEEAALELLKGMRSAIPNVAYALSHETAVSLEEALQHLEFASGFDRQIEGLRSSLSDLFAQFQTGVDGANTLGKSLLDILDNTFTVFTVGAGGFLPGFATGTPSAPTGWALLGEEGPELVGKDGPEIRYLQGGERVWNARDTARLLAKQGVGADTELVHVRPDELAWMDRNLGGRQTNPTTGLPMFLEGDSGGVGDTGGGGHSSGGSNSNGAGPMGGENAATGSAYGSTAERDAAYGGGWGGSGGDGGIGDTISGWMSAVTGFMSAIAGWQADTEANTEAQTAAMTSIAGLGMTAVAASLSAVASELGPGLTGFLEGITGEKGTAPAVGHDYGDQGEGGVSGTAGTIGERAVASAGSGSYRGASADVIDNTLAALAAAIKADPTGELTTGLVGASRVGGPQNATVQQIADAPWKIFAGSQDDPLGALAELDTAAQQLLSTTGQIPDVLRRALDGANAYAVELGIRPATTTRQIEQEQAQQRADALQTQFDGAGITKSRLAELNNIVKSLGDNTFDPIGKDFDKLATDMRSAAAAYTAAGQAVPETLFAATRQMEALGAARKRLLDEVAGTTVESTAEEKKVEQLRGQWSASATDLVKAFNAVGIAGDALTATLGQGLANAIRKEQDSYAEGLSRALRDAKGEKGYDDAVDLAKSYETELRNINALWPEGAERTKETADVTETLTLKMQALVKSGSITSKSLQEVIDAYQNTPAVADAARAALRDLNDAARATAENALADLTVRAKRAVGDNAGADNYAYALSQQREMADAVAKGMDGARLSGLRWIQTIEATQRAIEQAAAVQERSMALDQRVATLTGHTAAAAVIQYDIQSAREMRDARAQGWTPAQIAQLSDVQAAERQQALAKGQQQELLTALDAQIRAVNDNSQAARESAQGTRQLVDSYRQAIKDRALNTAISPLSPEEQLIEARRQAKDLYAEAVAGNVDARGQLVQLLTRKDEIARTFFGSTDSSDYYESQKMLSDLGLTMEGQLTLDEQAVKLADDQLKALQAERDAVAHYGERTAGGIEGLRISTAENFAVQERLLTALEAKWGGVANDAPKAPDKDVGAGWSAWMTDWFGRYNHLVVNQASGALSETEAYNQGAELWQEKVNQVNALPGEPAVWRAVIAAARGSVHGEATADWITQVAHDKGIPTFADGGDHLGGWRVVGERGWELEAVGPARYITQDQLAASLVAANGNDGWGARRPAVMPSSSVPTDGALGDLLREFRAYRAERSRSDAVVAFELNQSRAALLKLNGETKAMTGRLADWMAATPRKSAYGR